MRRYIVEYGAGTNGVVDVSVQVTMIPPRELLPHLFQSIGFQDCVHKSHVYMKLSMSPSGSYQIRGEPLTQIGLIRVSSSLKSWHLEGRRPKSLVVELWYGRPAFTNRNK